MNFEQENGSLCLFDSKNTLVFPILKEETRLLLSDKNYFENYLNLKYDAIDVLSEQGEKYYNERLEFMTDMESFSSEEKDYVLPYAYPWFIVSAKHKAVIGVMHIEKQQDKYVLFYDLNENYSQSGCLFSAVDLFYKWAFENGITNLVAKSSKNEKENAVFENKNMQKDENGDFVFEKE